MASNIKRYGPLLFLIIHPALLASVFALWFLRFISEQLALLLIGAVSLEAIYIASFIWVKLTRATRGLREMEKEIADMKEDAVDLARVQRELIYAGHQIKTLQMDLDSLKRGNGIKLSGNGHHRRVHI
ncbi:hypothetical protein HYU45_03340 [Candidatus Daviesbacteria bacterium]|nr:hypothetical protein [Candidatus Daviesbacteria bacterium]